MENEDTWRMKTHKVNYRKIIVEYYQNLNFYPVNTLNILEKNESFHSISL